MNEQERNPEARAVQKGQGQTQGYAPTGDWPQQQGKTVSGGSGQSFVSRISWGTIVIGVLVAIATQIVLSALGILVGFGTANATSITDLQNIGSGVGIYTAIAALVSMFVGGYVASRLASVPFSSDGLWHGISVWSLALVAMIVLSAGGVSGLLGFAGNAAGVLRDFVPSGVNVTPGDVSAAADVAASSAGFFLLGALLSLAAAALGGWLGSNRLSRKKVIAGQEPTAEQQRRMAA